jgi:hypothetical protein
MAKLKVGVDITSDGYTFLAVTLGSYGSWQIGLDLQNVIQIVNAKRLNIVQVFYGKHEAMNVNQFGSILFDKGEKPIPIGLFLANKNTVKFLKPGEVYKYFDAPKDSYHDGLHHEGWLDEKVKMFEKHKE